MKIGILEMGGIGSFIGAKLTKNIKEILRKKHFLYQL